MVNMAFILQINFVIFKLQEPKLDFMFGHYLYCAQSSGRCKRSLRPFTLCLDLILNATKMKELFQHFEHWKVFNHFGPKTLKRVQCVKKSSFESSNAPIGNSPNVTKSGQKHAVVSHYYIYSSLVFQKWPSYKVSNSNIFVRKVINYFNFRQLDSNWLSLVLGQDRIDPKT